MGHESLGVCAPAVPELPYCFVYPRAPINMAGVISLMIDYVLLKDRCTVPLATLHLAHPVLQH